MGHCMLERFYIRPATPVDNPAVLAFSQHT